MKSILSLLFLSCFLPSSALAINSELKTYKYNFAERGQFQVSYADYPQGEEVFYELRSHEAAALPPEIISNTPSLMISGNNHSDDLFMYAYKKLDGLEANKTYKVNFSVEFASNAPLDATGVGGSPGSSVYVKIGVLNEEPQRYIDEANYYRVCFDKGNQASGGKDMFVLGVVGVATRNAFYRLKQLSYQADSQVNPYTFTSNDKGEAWLVLGTDSAYESRSTLYYTNVVLSFEALN